MKVIPGNLWDMHQKGHWVCVPTNGIVKAGNDLVMGNGVARDAANLFPGLSTNWGALV